MDSLNLLSAALVGRNHWRMDGYLFILDAESWLFWHVFSTIIYISNIIHSIVKKQLFIGNSVGLPRKFTSPLFGLCLSSNAKAEEHWCQFLDAPVVHASVSCHPMYCRHIFGMVDRVIQIIIRNIAYHRLLGWLLELRETRFFGFIGHRPKLLKQSLKSFFLFQTRR